MSWEKLFGKKLSDRRADQGAQMLLLLQKFLGFSHWGPDLF